MDTALISWLLRTSRRLSRAVDQVQTGQPVPAELGDQLRAVADRLDAQHAEMCPHVNHWGCRESWQD